ncbi:MAG: hypothetical protein ACYS0I_10365 [Planctomycetota bacterium]|jgi:hypothetical protein
MQLRGLWILVLTLITFIFCGCKSRTSPDTALPTKGKVDLNTSSDELAENDKEEVLDIALKMSGQELSGDERSLVMRMLSLNEAELVKGLGVWVELLDGRYPSSLEPERTIPEVDALLKAKYDGGLIDEEQAKQKGHDVFFASAYYSKLLREKKDPAYYGDTVTVEDSDKMLMRWRISDGQYRVVFGDLSRKNVSAEQLAELEKESLE